MNLINNSHSDKEVASHIETKFRYIYRILETILKRKPVLGEKDIELRYDPVNGPIVYWPLSPEKYIIGLSVNGNYPSQMIYQIAHELCHLHIDPRINGLLIEIICQKTAIDFVEMLNPQFLGQANTDKYITDIKEAAYEKYSVQHKVDLDWMRRMYREKSLTKNILDREFNNIVAFVLKEHIDTYNKFGLIDHVRNSLVDNYETDINKLDFTNFYTTVDIDKFALNIGGDMGQTIRILLQ